MLITDNSMPVGSCQDDRWTINEKNKGILVHTRIWRRNTKQKKHHICTKNTNTRKNLSLRQKQICRISVFLKSRVLKTRRITSVWTCWALLRETQENWCKTPVTCIHRQILESVSFSAPPTVNNYSCFKICLLALTGVHWTSVPPDIIGRHHLEYHSTGSGPDVCQSRTAPCVVMSVPSFSAKQKRTR